MTGTSLGMMTVDRFFYRIIIQIVEQEQLLTAGTLDTGFGGPGCLIRKRGERPDTAFGCLAPQHDRRTERGRTGIYVGSTRIASSIV